MIAIKNMMTANIGIQRELSEFEEQQLASKIIDYMAELNVIGDIEVKKEGGNNGNGEGKRDIGDLLS